MPQTEKQRDFIKNFSEILEFLRTIFFYGCYTQADYKKLGISKTSYYQFVANLRSVMGEYITDVKLSNGQKAIAFRKDMFAEPHNALLELYSIKSFTTMQIFTALAIMQSICQSEKAFTIADGKKISNEKGEPSERTIERCLNHLAEQGFLTCERKGNKKFYSLSSDPFNDFSDTQFLAMAAAADFHRNVIPPATCGHYLLDYIKRRMNEEYASDYDSLFLFKHYHLGQILDDSILWELLQAIEAQEIVHFLYKGKTDRMTAPIYPYKIIVNEETGRRYLFGIKLHKNRKAPAIYRLDKIRTPKTIGKPERPFSPEEIQKIYQESLSYSFTGVCRLQKNTTPVVLAYQKELHHHVQQYFPDAISEELEPDWLKVSISVNSFTELKPWLFRNLRKIRILEAPEDTLADFEQDIREWRELYGIDQ